MVSILANFASRATYTIRPGSGTKAANQRIQENLVWLGFGELNNDGIIGEKTNAAIAKFKKSIERRGAPLTRSEVLDALERRARVARAELGKQGYALAAGYLDGKRRLILTKQVKNVTMRYDSAKALERLLAYASSQGLELQLNSGFRTYEQQKRLHTLFRQGRGSPADRAGYSDHQMGLSIDFGGMGKTGGYKSEIYAWLKRNAPRFGFIDDVRGEFWHWTYQPQNN